MRSAVFLPFDNLGLIIVDEEHETSYKQYDPAPRYHARDVALVIGQKQGAKVLLGSATPSIESYYNALSDRYRLVKLTERFGNSQLPDFELIDIKSARNYIENKYKNQFYFPDLEYYYAKRMLINESFLSNNLSVKKIFKILFLKVFSKVTKNR